MFAKRPIFRLVFTTPILASIFFTSLGVTPSYAASITVNTNADTVANDGFCTLREAIVSANSDSTIYPNPVLGECAVGSGADEITFNGNYTITLAGTSLPIVTSSIYINGNGAANTIIQANANPDNATYRVFSIGGSSGNLTLESLTVRHGRCTGECAIDGLHGGGILNIAGTLTVVDSIISENSASYGGGIYNSSWNLLTVADSVISGNNGQSGGGIYNHGGPSTVADSIISGNNGQSGGGIYNSGALTFTNTTVSENGGGYGGGIFNYFGTLTMINSTLSGNSAANDGGGIYNTGSSTLTITITDSTIFGNNAIGSGGGIWSEGDTLIMTGSTISGNSGQSGGGIYNNSGTLSIANNTTVSENSGNYGGGIFHNGGILTVIRSTASGNRANYNGGGIYIADGRLDVIDSTVSGNSAGGSGGGIFSDESDAYIILVITGSTISENTATDNGGGIYNFGDDITLTNSVVSGNSGGSGGGIYNVGEGNASSFTITNSIFTENNATSSGIFNDKGGGGIFNIDCYLTITSSIISGNSTKGNGGGIFNTAMNYPNIVITVMNTTIAGNSAINKGGGIYHGTYGNYVSGIANISSSTVSVNHAATGGGIYNDRNLSLYNSTLYGNSASADGGGIFNNFSAGLSNITLSGNSAANQGGGIFNDATLSYNNTIIANSPSGGDCYNNNARIGNSVNNLVEDGSCLASLSGDPNLAPLADNGGFTQTHALLSGSPAIDAGDDDTCPEADQRGISRPQGAHCDIGAFEYEYEAPTDIQLSASTLAENLPAGTTVGTLTTIDPDASDTHTYSFCGGTDDASFALAGNTLTTATMFDYELQNTFHICIRSADSGGQFIDKAFQILVQDVAENLAPETRIIKLKVKRGVYTFFFTSSASDSTFMCRLDQDAFVPCRNPTAYSELTAGLHTFQVYAIDPYGNVDLTSAEYSFTVEP